MKKKVISALLATTMVAAMLVGCGSNGTADAPAADDAQTEEPAADDAADTEEPAADDAQTEEPAAEEGKVLNIQCWN